MFQRIVLTVSICAAALIAPASLSAGAAGGPKIEFTHVAALSTDRFNAVVFRGGDEAIVTVSGDGDTDLDLYVYDENGILVAKDDDQTDDCVARWVPRWTGRFYIVVMNRGRVFNEYTLQTN